MQNEPPPRRVVKHVQQRDAKKQFAGQGSNPGCSASNPLLTSTGIAIRDYRVTRIVPEFVSV